ncbi:MAG: glycosyltransferase [Ilyomonas sp.]
MKIAIIDPVGIKAGMNCYDLGLLNALQKKKVEAYSFSNFYDEQYPHVHQYNFFLFEKKNIVSNLLNYVIAHFRAAIMCKRKGIKWIIFHVFSTTAKDYFSFLLFKIFRLEPIAIIHDVESLTDADVGFFKKQIYKLSAKLVVHNRTSERTLIKSLDEDEKKKLHVIPHGNYIPFVSAVTQTDFFSDELAFDPRYKYLLFFGQIKRVKGLDVLLKAIPYLPSDYKIIVAGRPQKDDIGYYQALIKEFAIEERVQQVIRFITDAERNFLFEKCDALILPYRKIFQSGVLLLAMSYQLPVVVSNLPANREIICDGENGMIFTDGDAPDLAKKVMLLFENNTIERVRKSAYQTVAEHYSWSEIADQYIQLTGKKNLHQQHA